MADAGFSVRLQHFRRFAGLAILALISACNGNCGGAGNSSNTGNTSSGPRVKSSNDGDGAVRVVNESPLAILTPAEAHSPVGSSVQFSVQVWDTAGNYIWLADRPDIRVRWEASPTVIVGDADVETGYSLDPIAGPTTSVVITSPNIESLHLRAVAVLSESDTLAIALGVLYVAGSATSPPVADRVTAITSEPVIGLLDGCKLVGTTLNVVHSLLYSFVGSQDLNENLTELNCTRPAEFALFSTTHRLQFRDATTLGGLTIWSDAQGDVLRGDTLPWEMPDLIDLHLHYFSSSDPTLLKALGQTRVKEANTLFAANRVGMQFVAVPSEPLSAQSGSCATAYVENTLGIDLTAARLNVAFVTNLPMGAQGLACPAQTNRNGRILFLTQNSSDETLAHEIAHALSHEYPGLAFDHVGSVLNTLPGFAKNNLMHEKIAGHPREFLTLGQVFRLNVDTGSWYQHDPGILLRHAKRACGCEPFALEPCPPLHRNLVELPVTNPGNYCPL